MIDAAEKRGPIIRHLEDAFTGNHHQEAAMTALNPRRE